MKNEMNAFVFTDYMHNVETKGLYIVEKLMKIKNVLAISLLLMLTGCGTLKPGMSVDQARLYVGQKDSLYEYASSANYTYYINKDYSGPNSKRLVYVFKNGKFEKTISDSDMQAILKGFDNAEDYQLANKIDVNSAKDFYVLKDFGINSVEDYNNARIEQAKNKQLYDNKTGPSEVRRYVGDAYVAKTKSIPLSKVVAGRKELAAQYKLEAEKQALEERRQQAVFAQKYPYTAILSCTVGAGLVALEACFVGAHKTNSELEVRNGNSYRMYQAWEVGQAGKRTNEGLEIPLESRFAIRAQNAHADLLLNLTVVKTDTRSVLYQKSASKWGVVAASH